MKNRYLLFFIKLFFFLQGSAQVVNVDREVKNDSVHKDWSFYCDVDISSDKQKENIIDLDISLDINKYFKNKYVLIGLFKNAAVFSGSNKLQNEGLYHIRYRDMDTRKLSLEPFIQYQWNGLWGMEYRYLGGMNLRVKLFDKKAADLYSGFGFFYENEKWNCNGVKAPLMPSVIATQLRQNLRMNNYLKFAMKISETIDVSSISFLQFPLSKNFSQPRWYFETSCYIKAAKHLNIVLNWDHIYDKNTVVPIDHFYYGYSTGIQLNF